MTTSLATPSPQSTVPEGAEFIFDETKHCIIDEKRWRIQQRALLALKPWYFTPNDVVRPFFEGIKKFEEANKQEQFEIKKHIARDPVAFAHSFGCYVDRDTLKWARGDLTPGQLVIIWKFTRMWLSGKPVRLILLKQRRGGFSLGIAIIMSWIHFFRENRGGMSVANDKGVSEQITQYIKDIWERLPDWLRPARRYSNKKEFSLEEPDEKKRLKGDHGLKSFLKVESVGKDYAGTGSPLQAVHGSEVGKWESACNPETQYTSVTNTVPEAPNTLIFLESTAHGANTFFHSMWTDAVRMGSGEAGWNGFIPIFIPWYFDLRNTRKAPPGLPLGANDDEEFGDEIKEKDRYGLDVDQLYWRQVFIAKQTRKKGVALTEKVSLFRQEYPANHEEAWRYASGRFLTDSIYQKIRSACLVDKEPIYVGDVDPKRKDDVGLDIRKCIYLKKMGPLRIWEYPVAGHEYFIAADVSSGQSVDSSCCFIYRRAARAHLVAEWYGLALPDDFANIMWRLGWCYNTAMIGWERTGPGLGIAVYLRRDDERSRGDAGVGYPTSRLYRQPRTNNARISYDAGFGFMTSYASKRPLLDEWISLGGDGLIDLREETLLEASSLRQDEDDERKVVTKGADRFMASVFAASMHIHMPAAIVEKPPEERKRLNPVSVDAADAAVDAEMAQAEEQFTAYDKVW